MTLHKVQGVDALELELAINEEQQCSNKTTALTKKLANIFKGDYARM